MTEYAAVMKNDGWILNGQPIVFGKRGRIIDGVQRLYAAIEANANFETLVVYGVDERLRHTIDQHAKRSYQNVLESRGWRDAGAIVRTASWLLRYRRGVVGLPPTRARSISWVAIDRFLAEQPAIRHGVEMAKGAPAGSPLPALAREVVAALACAANKGDEARLFLEDLTYGVSGGAVTAAQRPGQALALQARQLRSNGAPLRDMTAIGFALLAFDDHLAGRPGRLYQWKPDYAGVELRDNGRPVHWNAEFPVNLGTPCPSFVPESLRPRGRAESQGDSARAPTLTQEFDFDRPSPAFAGAAGDDASLFGAAAPVAPSRWRDIAARSDLAQVDVKIETLTPQRAREWLATFNYNNRRLQTSNVDSFVRDMRNGDWRLNGQPLCFSAEGRLINGQHRLQACAEAGVEIAFLVARGLPDEAFATYDIQARKSVSALQDQADDEAAEKTDDDESDAAPKPLVNVDPRVLDAAAKLLWESERGGKVRGVLPTSSEILATLERHPRLRDGYAQARRMKNIASSGVMTYVIYVVMSEDAKLGADFLASLETGENLTRKNPLLKLRDAILSDRAGRARRDASAHLLEVWRAYLDWRVRTDGR